MSLVSAVVGLASGVIDLVSYERQTKYRDRLFSLRKSILDEELKPVSEQNDAALEAWYRELEIVLEALSLEPLAVPSAPASGVST
jgi:hypothetical protein